MKKIVMSLVLASALISPTAAFAAAKPIQKNCITLYEKADFKGAKQKICWDSNKNPNLQKINKQLNNKVSSVDVMSSSIKKVTLYDEPNLNSDQGSGLVISGDERNLKDKGFDNKTSSVNIETF